MSFPGGLTRVALGVTVCTKPIWRHSARFAELGFYSRMGMPRGGRANGLAFWWVLSRCIGYLVGLLSSCERRDMGKVMVVLTTWPMPWGMYVKRSYRRPNRHDSRSLTAE